MYFLVDVFVSSVTGYLLREAAHTLGIHNYGDSIKELSSRLDRLESTMNTPTFIQAAYYSPGRTFQGISYTPKLIVLHWMDTTLAGADFIFEGKTSRQVSAHYGIGADGTEHQYVEEADTAWQAGDWMVNLQSIGVEHEGWPGHAITGATYQQSIARIADICHRYNIDPLGSVIIRTNTGFKTLPTLCPHNLIVATECPGTLNVQAIRTAVSAAMNMSGVDQPLPTVPNATTTAYEVPVHFQVVITVAEAHFRKEPTTASQSEGLYPKGATFMCDATVTGQVVTIGSTTTDQWYRSVPDQLGQQFYISAAVSYKN